MKPPPSKKKEGGDNPHPKNFKNPPFCWISPNKKLIPPFSHVPCCPSPDHGQHIGKKGNSNSLHAIITHNFACSRISHKHLSAAESNAPFLGGTWCRIWGTTATSWGSSLFQFMSTCWYLH